MKLENLQIALARRNPWQATDLGLQVARQHYGPLFIISLTLTCVLSLLLWALCQNAVIACLLLFWFKPIIERPLLFFISRAIFADAPTIKQSLLSLTGGANRLWFKTLFIHRFSLSRSFNDPVVLLEGLKGDARSNRLRVLHNSSNGSGWLSMLGIHIEYAIQMAIFVLPLILLPSGVIDFEFSDIFETGDSVIAALTLITYAIAVALVAPFYVCCGFILYLNQRTHLEAWDIELGFKKISGRLASLSSLSSLSVLVLVSVLSFSPGASWADEPEEVDEATKIEEQQAEKAAIEEYYPASESAEAQQVRSALNDILNSDLFGKHYKDKEYSLDWDWSWDFEPDEKKKQDELPWLSLIKEIALYFKYLMILLLGLLLLYILVKYQPWLYLPGFKIQKKEKPQSILGMDMSEQSLPDNFLQIISGHLTRQQFREALSLMFRAHLINAIHVKNMPFKQSNTEQECLVIMQAHSPQDEAQCFADLVMHWQMLAYAHQSANAQALQSLFEHWQTFVAQGQVK